MADLLVIRTNLPDFKKQLKDLGEVIEKRIARSAIRKGAKVIERAVAQAAPLRTGVLKRAIRSGPSRFIRGRGVVAAYVGVRSGVKQRSVGKKKVNRDAFYWRWVEDGHRIVPRGAKLSGRGERTRAVMRSRFDAAGGKRVAGSRYLQRGFNASVSTAVDAVYRELSNGIAKESAKR